MATHPPRQKVATLTSSQAAAVAALTTAGTSGSGAFVRVTDPSLVGVDALVSGASLTNADATVAPASDKASKYVLPSTVTLTENRTITVDSTGMTAGQPVLFERRDRSTKTLSIACSGVLFIFPASPTKDVSATFYCNGTTLAFGVGPIYTV